MSRRIGGAGAVYNIDDDAVTPGGGTGTGGGNTGGGVVPDDDNDPDGDLLDTRQFFDGVDPWATPGEPEGSNNWTVLQGASPSADTGPIGGSAAGRAADANNTYIYVESSDLNENDWTLTSPVLDASLGTVAIIFDVFMRFGVGGALDDGTLTIEGWNGTVWGQIGDLITGSQQTNATDDWLPSTGFDAYDSTGFTNDDFQFRLRFNRGAGDAFNYDCAIDRLEIYGPAGAIVDDAGGGNTGGGNTVNRVGIFAEFRGEDGFGPISGLFNTNFSEPEHAHSQVNITSPSSLVFAGTRSRQIEIKDGDRQWDVDANTTTSEKRRNEYEWTPVRFNNREDGWAGMAFYLPSDPMAAIRGCAIFQLHYFPDPSQMVVASLFGGTLQIRNPSHPNGEQTIRDLSIAPYLDKWTALVVNFRSSRFSDGFIKIFLDGQQIADYQGVNKKTGNGGPYWKNGAYFWGYDKFDSTRRAKVICDNISLGNSNSNFESVDPNNWE